MLAGARTLVYLAIGENDSYYGADSLKQAYQTLRGLYMEQGMAEEEIDKILVLDVKGQNYFTDRGYQDQHAGGQAFAHDETVMGWLFGEHGEDG